MCLRIINIDSLLFDPDSGINCVAAPAGKPTITTAHNTSSTALHISWRPPHHETIHGEFLGYKISYRPRDRGDDAIKEIYIRDPSAEVSSIW